MRVFDIETIKKAAYRMSGYCVVDFAIEEDDVVCKLRPLTGRVTLLASELADAFQTEVLDQDLRRIVGDESASVRNAILAYAFSRTGLQEE
jgi:His-Xaa-Ser system protein HxsD